MTRQHQQLYVNVWQAGPVKIKQCTETVADHYSLHTLLYSTAVDAVCTKRLDGLEFHLICEESSTETMSEEETMRKKKQHEIPH